jgi:hypothetical protein
MLTTTPKRNPASKSNRSDAVLDRLRATRGSDEGYERRDRATIER